MFQRRVTGASSSAEALGFVRHGESRPGTIRVGKATAQPLQVALNARVPSRETPGDLTVSQAKKIVDGLSPATPHAGPLGARTLGRRVGALTSALRAVAHGFGVGGGAARKVNAQWTPDPGQQAGVSPQGGMERSLRKQYATRVQAQAREYVDQSGAQVRSRMDARDVVYAATAPAEAASQQILTSSERVKTQHQHNVIEVVVADKNLRYATGQLNRADLTLNNLPGERADLLANRSQLLHSLSTNKAETKELVAKLQNLPAASRKMHGAAIKCAKKMDALASSEQRLQLHQGQLNTAKSELRGAVSELQQHMALPAAAQNARDSVLKAQASVDFQKARLTDLDQPNRQADLGNEQITLLRGAIQGRLQACEERLSDAKVELDSVLQKIGSAAQFSRKEASLRSAVQTCEREVKYASNVVQLMGACVNSRKAAVTRAEQKLNRLKESAGPSGLDRASIEARIEVLRERHGVLQRSVAALEKKLQKNQDQLSTATTSRNDAQQAVDAARSNLEKAKEAKAASQDWRDGLEAQLQRLVPLLEPRAHADRDVEAGSAQLHTRRQQKMLELQSTPPGFDVGSTGANLRRQMGHLAQRLADTGEGQRAQSFVELIPGDQALEIISRCLAHATDGQVDRAAAVLEQLMNQPLASLVPAPKVGDGDQTEQTDAEQSVEAGAKRAVANLLQLPGGRALVARMVQPSDVAPSLRVQDAVAVYFKATTELRTAPNGETRQWLQDAARAARRVAHAGPSGASLTVAEATAFNGVRNGFTVVGPGSAYEKVNATIEKSLGDWMVGVSGAKRRATSPWHGRGLLSGATQHMSLPSVERDLAAELNVACDELLRVTSRQLAAARSDVMTARRLASGGQDQPFGMPFDRHTQVPEPLVEAHALLTHLKDSLDRGELPVVDKKAWRSIDKSTKRQQRAEAGVNDRPSGPLSDWLVKGAPGATKPLDLKQMPAQESDYDTLQAGLLELKANKKSSALQVLRALNDWAHDLTPDDESVTATTASLTSASSTSSRSLDESVRTPAQDAAPSWVSASLLRPRKTKTTPPSLTTVPESTTVNRWPNATSGLPVPGGDSMRPGLPNNAPAKSKLNGALDRAEELQELVDAFQNPEANPAPDVLIDRMSRTIADPSKEPTFGSVSLSDSRVKGLGTGGLVGVATQVASGGSLVGRVDLRVSQAKTSSLTVSRDSQGIQQQLLSKVVTKRVGAGLEASVGFGVGKPGGPSFVGAIGSVNQDISWTNDKGGVILRLPKFDGKTDEQLTADFRSMMGTSLNWQDFEDEDGQPLYSNPLQALLHQHPDISISSVEESLLSHTASSSLGFLSGVALPVGDRGGSAIVAGAVGVGTSSTRRQGTFATTTGTQGLEGMVAGRRSEVSAFAGRVVRLGGAPETTPNLAGMRARVLNLEGEVILHRAVDQAGASLIRQPDGSILADRSVEYSNYAKFEAAVNAHREKWVQAGMQTGRWPEGFSEADKRIAANDALDQFMDAAKARLKSGSVTLNETMDVKLDVCAELTGNLALEHLARSEERHADADALRAARDELVADESSYQAFWLKLFDSGSRSRTTGFNAVVQATRTQTASASHMLDRYPPRDIGV